MKRCLFPIFLTALSLAFSSFAWGEEPRVEFSFRTYPEEIHWGDPFFAYFTACNKDDCPVRVVRQHNHGPDAGTLFSGDEVVYRWLVPERLNYLEGVFGLAMVTYAPRFFLLKPQEERVVEFGMFWLPQPDHPADREAEALRLRLGESGETFVFKADIKWRSGY